MSRLEEIEARANAATAGPWDPTDYSIQKVEPPWDVSHSAIAHDVERDEDRIFIAHARSDIPWLLAEVKWLREKWRMDVALVHGERCFSPPPHCGCPDMGNNPPTHDTPGPG